jgi:hypothetical protein
MSDPNVVTDLALAEIVRPLIAAFQPERIYLFGSRARGDAGADSDYDLLVVVPDDASPERRRSRLGYQALRGTGVTADVMVWTCSAFDSPCAPARIAAIHGCRRGHVGLGSMIRLALPILFCLERASTEIRAGKHGTTTEPPLPVDMLCRRSEKCSPRSRMARFETPA